MRLAASMLAFIALIGDCGDDEAETAASRPPANPAVLQCANCTRTDSARAEQLDPDGPQHIRAGPLILASAHQYADMPKSDFAPARGGREPLRYHAQKMLLLLEGDDAVTLEVPPAHRKHAALLYVDKRGYKRAERERGLAEISDGYGAVRFEPHPGDGPLSEIPGGLVVAGARCLPLRAWVEGTEAPTRAMVSFGAGDRCATVASSRRYAGSD